MAKPKDNSIVRVQASPEYRQLVNQTIEEMDELTKLAIKSGLPPEQAKEKIAAMYIQNLQMSDDIILTAKKNVAELMTRIQLDRALNPDEELVSEKYIKLFKLQNETLKLIKDMEPKKITNKMQIDDDKLIFKIRDVEVKEDVN